MWSIITSITEYSFECKIGKFVRDFIFSDITYDLIISKFVKIKNIVKLSG